MSHRRFLQITAIPLLILFAGVTPANASPPAGASPTAGLGAAPLPTPPDPGIPQTPRTPPQDLLTSYAFPPYTPSLCGVRSGVLLTIDDYPYSSPTTIESVATWARNRGIMMQGFPIAKYTKAYQQATGVDLVARARAQHMYISNHTYDHRDLTMLSDTMISYEIRYGIRSTTLRPPYGSYNARVKAIAESLGYRICTWNIDTRDWEKINGVYPSINTIRNRIFMRLRDYGLTPGRAVVILGHYYTNYPAALRYIYGDLLARGYKYCPLPAAPTTYQVPYPICAVS